MIFLTQILEFKDAILSFCQTTMDTAKNNHSGVSDGNVLLATLVDYCKNNKTVPGFIDTFPDELYNSIGSSLMVARPLAMVLEEEKDAVLKIDSSLISSYEKMNAPGCTGCNKRKHASIIKQFLLQKDVSGLSEELVFKLKYSPRAKGKSIPNIRREVVINMHKCLDCTLKHVSDAIIQMGEIRKGFWGTNHETFCRANIDEASQQIDAISNDIAMQLRDIRKSIFEKKFLVEISDIEALFAIYWELVQIGIESFGHPPISVRNAKQLELLEKEKQQKILGQTQNAEQPKNQYQMKIVSNKSGCGRCGKKA